MGRQRGTRKRKEVPGLLNTKMVERLIRERGMMEQEVAFKIGVSPSAFTYYKFHKRDMRAKQLRLLADVFGVTMDELYRPNPKIKA